MCREPMIPAYSHTQTVADTTVRVCLFVDDYLCRGPRQQLEKFFSNLCAAFEHKPPTYLEDEPDGLYFVGLHVTHLNNARWSGLVPHGPGESHGGICEGTVGTQEG